jgi:hypothetical protein
LVDTIREVFLGGKTLFEGLWIATSDYGFNHRPVIRLDMSSLSNDDARTLKQSIMDLLEDAAKSEQVGLWGAEPSALFRRLIDALYEKYGERVVILIDEYDKPILDHIADTETAEANRAVLRSFYGVLKSMDAKLHFVFITGVTRFARASIFSGLNNLVDITLNERFANICGFTAGELDILFAEHMSAMPDRIDYSREEHIGLTATDLRGAIFEWYDGYSWDGETRLFNPFSVLNFFWQGEFSPYWFSSGTPKFLLDLILKSPGSYPMADDLCLSKSSFDAADIDNIALAPLLFQTGYLTIDTIEKTIMAPTLMLKFPNFEVSNAFHTHILAALTDASTMQTDSAYRNISAALYTGKPEKLEAILRGLFASIPYELHIEREAYYHTVFYILLKQFGFAIEAEVSASGGRIDGVLELSDGKVYIVEMKYRKCPQEAGDEEKQTLLAEAAAAAFAQIDSRGYAERYAGSGKTIIRVAVAVTGRADVAVRWLC